MAELYWRGTSAGNLAATLARSGKLVGKMALRRMRKVSKLVMEQSIRDAPLDWRGPVPGAPPGHELEQAHHIVEKVGDGRRIEATVEVGGMVGDIDVDLYARYIHEGSWSHLGKGSIAKQAANPEAKVGKYFLERALEDHEDDFEPLLEEVMRSLMG